jgi:hypothetical protein
MLPATTKPSILTTSGFPQKVLNSKSTKTNSQPEKVHTTSLSSVKSTSTTSVSFVEPVTSAIPTTSKASETFSNEDLHTICNQSVENRSECKDLSLKSESLKFDSKATEHAQNKGKLTSIPSDRSEHESMLKPLPSSANKGKTSKPLLPSAKHISSKNQESAEKVHFEPQTPHSVQRRLSETNPTPQDSENASETAPSKAPSKRNNRDSNILECTRI